MLLDAFSSLPKKHILIDFIEFKIYKPFVQQSGKKRQNICVVSFLITKCGVYKILRGI